MRRFIFILCFVKSLYAQKSISGYYTFKNGHIILKADNSFTYYDLNCGQELNDTGTWEFSNDTLYLTTEPLIVDLIKTLPDSSKIDDLALVLKKQYFMKQPFLVKGKKIFYLYDNKKNRKAYFRKEKQHGINQ